MSKCFNSYTGTQITIYYLILNILLQGDYGIQAGKRDIDTVCDHIFNIPTRIHLYRVSMHRGVHRCPDGGILLAAVESNGSGG